MPHSRTDQTCWNTEARDLGLIAAYRAHNAFTGLAQRTRENYQRIFDYLKPIDGTALFKFNRPLVVQIRDKAFKRGRRFANYVKAVLSIIFGWGVERDYLKFNAAEKVKNIRQPKACHNQIARGATKNVTRSGRLTAVFDPAVALMMFTGLGPKERIEITPQLLP